MSYQSLDNIKTGNPCQIGNGISSGSAFIYKVRNTMGVFVGLDRPPSRTRKP